ncbi:MAG: serine/threonine-protein phosphatase [Gammaproteobacteria bacterium]|nr:serine/threonine-protein phosphatase [Gammaproteobacteria bacterium]
MKKHSLHEQAHVSLVGDRSENQDSCTLVRSGGMTLMGLADGMGGHPKGKKAAQIFTEECGELGRNTQHPIKAPHQFLIELFGNSHQQILEFGLSQTPTVFPRTTAVAALLQDDEAWWAHVGDSRLYIFRKGRKITQTTDHSYVQRLHQNGKISNRELISHPHRNVVTRCLGGNEIPSEIELGHCRLEFGDIILLCSDGLWSSVEEELISDTLCSMEVRDAINVLAEEAALSSFPDSDNVTLIALKWCSNGGSADTVHDREPDPLTHPAADNLDKAIADLQQLVDRFEWDKDK